MGLGDHRIEGIKMFCMQHRCNKICEKFKLPDVQKMVEEIPKISAENIQQNGMFIWLILNLSITV
jgi:hypothetical protein